ncbi:MAG: aminotransferase class III-fold pyridoxal phosphate-dependent enzyme [Planctomycetaceae bacterium]|jgi:glutamate-1-semialdehyde 2,1-aminomutase|nr:aminotransferase class III-fold pyridoxal phosphate-dependent enzyme [Planctomycetaceae bacterium]
MYRTFTQSEQFLERSLKSIPLGSQTFSKSLTQYPHGVSPFFMQKAKGSRTWDIDGNEYIDMINGLCAITLGHCDPDVTAAVKEQLENGVIFSLPHPLETEVAEKIIEMVPCAEAVRFGKNGSDATAGAVRVARGFTKRDYVAVCGYHGWQDWYIGTTSRNLGVPKATQELSLTFKYNDIESLYKLFKEYPDKIAAVIMEPMGFEEPKDQFLHKVKELANQNGSLFILDETITGFRISNGGAQELYGVTPDLATFGKGMGNGYPISVVAGRADIMKLMEEVFFSFTFGGECLSLAAAKTVMTKLKASNAIAAMQLQGAKLFRLVNDSVRKHGLESVILWGGHPCWQIMAIQNTSDYKNWEIKTLIMQEMFLRGVLTIGTNNMSYAHTDNDIDFVAKTYDEIYEIVAEVLKTKTLYNRLRCKPIEPLFKVR